LSPNSFYVGKIFPAAKPDSAPTPPEAAKSPRQMFTILIIFLAAFGLILWTGKRRKNVP
jgi:hypothetical protein